MYNSTYLNFLGVLKQLYVFLTLKTPTVNRVQFTVVNISLSLQWIAIYVGCT